MTETHRAAIAVGKVNMAQTRPRQAESVRHAALLDVHVEQVAEQFHVLRAERFQQQHRVVHPVEQIRFVTVERFKQQRHAMIPGPWRHVFEGFGEPRDSLLPRYQAFPSALHGPNNRRSTKTPGNFDHRRREFPGAPAGFRVKIGQAQFVNHPASAGSHCRQREPMLRQELLEPGHVQFLRGPWKNLDRIESEGGRRPASVGQVVPENEWAAAGLRHQRNCDSGAHLRADA